MTGDLIERLRSVDISWSETGEWCAEAADRIEALTAENERLRNVVGDRMDFYLDRIEDLTAEVQAWRECALYDATMEGPVFKGWDRSALERCRRAALTGDEQ